MRVATISLEEVSAEWMYSNPTGKFNLSLSDKPVQTKDETETYEEFMTNSKKARTFEVKKWSEHKQVGPVLLRVVLLNPPFDRSVINHRI